MKTRLNLELRVCGLKNRGLSTIVRALYDWNAPIVAVHVEVTQLSLSVIKLPLIQQHNFDTLTLIR
jgi:hypothetical protein